MTIAVLTLAVGPSPEDLARCYLRSHKDAYKLFSALCVIQPLRASVRDHSSIEPGGSPRRISQKAVLTI